MKNYKGVFGFPVTVYLQHKTTSSVTFTLKKYIPNLCTGHGFLFVEKIHNVKWNISKYYNTTYSGLKMSHNSHMVFAIPPQNGRLVPDWFLTSLSLPVCFSCWPGQSVLPEKWDSVLEGIWHLGVSLCVCVCLFPLETRSAFTTMMCARSGHGILEGSMSFLLCRMHRLEAQQRFTPWLYEIKNLGL